MMTLWDMGPSISAGELLLSIEGRNPPAFEWVNRFEYCKGFEPHFITDEDGLPLGQVKGIDQSSFLKPKLRCTQPGFAPDLIFWGEYFVSARLVETLDLPPSSVQLLEVDCSECTPEMQAAGYRVLNLLAFANPMDREQSEPADFVAFDAGDGRTDHVWRFRGAGPNGPAPRIVWRKDFVAPAPLFRVPGSNWTLATEELAARVMAGGYRDVSFYDYTVRGQLVERSAG